MNNVTDIINLVLSGGLLGALGQGIRLAVGLKKMNDTKSTTEPKEGFNGNRLVLSIFIGFVAGAIGMLIKQPASTDINTQFIITIIATGYAGADFIEGFFNTTFSKITGTATTPSNADGTPSSNNAPSENPDIPVA